MVGDKKVKKDIVSNYICERKNNLYDIWVSKSFRGKMLCTICNMSGALHPPSAVSCWQKTYYKSVGLCFYYTYCVHSYTYCTKNTCSRYCMHIVFSMTNYTYIHIQGHTYRYIDNIFSKFCWLRVDERINLIFNTDGIWFAFTIERRRHYYCININNMIAIFSIPQCIVSTEYNIASNFKQN